MIKTKDEYRSETRSNMRGGNGEIRFGHIWSDESDPRSSLRMLATIELDPGSSIGYHVHENEEEFFYIVSGSADADDNGVPRVLQAGDTMLTRSGEGHSIATRGDQKLILLAGIPIYRS